STLVSGGATGIIINGAVGSSVNLRGITVQGIGFGGGTGLKFNSGASLTITNCVFRNHTGKGIDFRPNAGGTYNLLVSHTLVADNGDDGIFVDPTAPGATVRVAINRVRSVNNSSHGVSISGASAAGTGTIMAAVTDSVSANNGGIGFLSFSSVGSA